MRVVHLHWTTRMKKLKPDIDVIARDSDSDSPLTTPEP